MSHLERNMPIKSENKKRYPRYWKELSIYIRTILADNKCEFCSAENYKPHPITGSKVILTVAHLNQMPEENDRLNLRALCQKCHFAHDRQFRNNFENKFSANVKQVKLNCQTVIGIGLELYL